MRHDLAHCYAGSRLVHYTWKAYARTLCGRERHLNTPFTSAPAQCVVCVAIWLAFPQDASLKEQLCIAIDARGFL